MMRIVRAYLAFLRASVAVMFHYRGEIVLWAIWGLVNPAVLYAMWSSAAQSNADQTVAGYDRGQFAAYFFVMMIVGHFATAWDIYEIGYLIRNGRLSPILLRPLMPIWEAMAGNTAYKIVILAFVIPMWALFAWLVTPTFATQGWQFGLGVVALALSATLSFMLGYVVALAGFWITKLDAVAEIYFGLGMFLGGRFAPLSALPGPVYWVAWGLPFRWIYAFPTELLMGKLDRQADALFGLGVQAAWLFAAAAAFRLLWKLALKRYTAVSG